MVYKGVKIMKGILFHDSYCSLVSIVETNNALEYVGKHYKSYENNSVLIKKVFGDDFNWYNGKFGTNGYLFAITDEKANEIISEFENLKKEKEEENKVFLKKLHEDYEKDLSVIRKLNENFKSKKYLLYNGKHRVELKLLGIFNRYNVLVSYNDGEEEKANILFSEKHNYPFLSLAFTKIMLEMNQQLVDDIWSLFKGNTANNLYSYTTLYKVNFEE